ncbi:hypothetical protein M404DRAFT_292551 [Pisolithus tinctorius Marx 270]|uniref:Uncharacterized protein n=1 Tax=Pisolithus tinctorius Marx 270 TaxID=870435 RepID=A0A0C3N4L3_PISTI|nr:hypothetical protein M404DRAFT_292551 [Pisolithus tinctorius Marx 270]
MSYVLSGWHKKGTEVEVDVRNKLRVAVVTPMPFITPNYWRGRQLMRKSEHFSCPRQAVTSFYLIACFHRSCNITDVIPPF